VNAVELIERKRDGGRLSDAEIAWLIDGYVADRVADYQMAAMAMTIYLHGLDDAELAAWTGAMLHSGEVFDLSEIDRPKIDKHSTGGVGDKVSIPLAPMVAACGVAVPMMSGRGLGHTGGTLDKLESIPGMEVRLDGSQISTVIKKCGFVMAGQTDNLVPADRKLYALRDATGTVPSIPLIASSIMSKKLAEDLDGLVLDVKVGSGAFMTDLAHARLLASTMVGIGANHGVPVVALLTAMDQPLGNTVGNSLEIAESVELLRGSGPPDLLEVTLELGSRMLALAGIENGTETLQRVVADGRAFELLLKMVELQGGDPGVLADPSLLPTAPQTMEVTATHTGFVGRCDAKAIGVAAMRLGAGRELKEDKIDHAVGITLLAKVGDPVEAGQPLARIHYRDTVDPAAVESAFSVSESPVPSHQIILEEIR